jgi:hypothetical protein
MSIRPKRRGLKAELRMKKGAKNQHLSSFVDYGEKLSNLIDDITHLSSTDFVENDCDLYTKTR